MKSKLLLLLVSTTLLLLTACSNKDKIIVGSKNFTESYILAEIYSLALENAGYTVERKFNLGGTLIAHSAIVNGDIDIYPEYTGTGLLSVLKESAPANNNKDAIYNIVRSQYKEKFKLIWLNSTNANNSQAVAISAKTAKKLGISKISDLPKFANQLSLAAVAEFRDRYDGLPGLEKTYGKMPFKLIKLVDYGIKYNVVLDGDFDLTVAFTTDGALKSNDIIVLKDDKNFFPSYYATPVVREALLQKKPEIAEVLNKVSALINTSNLLELNYEVDVEKKEYSDVAKKFMVDNGLMK